MSGNEQESGPTDTAQCATIQNCFQGDWMLQPGKAVKVTVYLSEGATHRGVPLYSSILDFLFYRGVAGATVTKGIAGFGADHHMHTTQLVDISDRLPIKIEFIESREKVESILGKLEELAGTGLIEMQETTVAKPAQTSKAGKAKTPSHLKIEGKAQMMRIYLSEEDRWNDKPLYKALVEAMRANDIAGVTVYRGVMGYGAHRHMHKDKALLGSHHGSVMLSVIDTAEKLKALMPLVDKMLAEGLVVFSDVDIVKFAYRPLEADADGAEQNLGPGQVPVLRSGELTLVEARGEQQLVAGHPRRTVEDRLAADQQVDRAHVLTSLSAGPASVWAKERAHRRHRHPHEGP